MERLEELVEISNERKFTTLDILKLIQALSEIYGEQIKAQQKEINALSSAIKMLQVQLNDLHRLRSLNQDQINEIDKHLGGVLYE